MPANWTVARCPECASRRSPLTRVRSAFCYEGLVREMIHQVKYGHRAHHLRFFSLALFPLLRREFGVSPEVLIPVPLHRDRQWERRFNQAQLLARHLSLFSGIPVCSDLRKVAHTPSQSSLSGIARRRNLRNCFAFHSKHAPPRSALLIDDVITTGTTLRQCAIALRMAGVRRVYALTIARALKQF